MFAKYLSEGFTFHVSDVGDRIKEHVVIKMQVDSMEMEDQKKIDELIEALRNKVDGKAIEIRAIGEEICKKQMDAIMGRYQNKYIVSRETSKHLSKFIVFLFYLENQRFNRKNHLGLD